MMTAVRFCCFALLLTGLCGCPQYRDPRVPNPIEPMVEPDLGREYLVYTPSTYDPARSWPLIVVCHGTRPWDTPLRQIRDWVKLAEVKGFVVVAPSLKGTKGDFPPPAEKQIKRQREDEETILAMVRHVQGSHNISRDRIFLAGWSAGNYAVLYTGLKHPELFRALAVLQGNFDSVYLSEVAGCIDPYQPIFVLYGSIDILTGKQGKHCVKWLREHHAAITPEETGGTHKGHPTKAYEFFSRVIRKVPWLRIRAFLADSGDPMSVQFKTHASFELRAYRWDFGDGESSPVATPLHTYAKPGDYTVTLTVETESGRRVRRVIALTVPQKQPHQGI
ncbi:MAG: PKD domain-containing protein [Phycisphaerae bacterium]|nr:PKD domain-containing protein [Phycisphaerae bacterium]